MKTSPQKELYGLIGYPVKHSYSASMHNAAFMHYNINAEYQLFEVAPEELEEFFKKTIKEKKIKGLNVTVPYKEKAYDYLVSTKAKIEFPADLMKAVNTVRIEGNGDLTGFNTDGDGFLRDLDEKNVRVKGKDISLIGAGGGAKAIAHILRSPLAAPKRLLIFDVDRQKADQLIQLLGQRPVEVQAVNTIEELRLKESDVLINATPIGMKETDPLLVKKEWLHKNLFVYDLIYNPAETKLLKAAREAGCHVSNGLGMLVYQGALAFSYWTHKGTVAEIASVMRRTLEEKLHA